MIDTNTNSPSLLVNISAIFNIIGQSTWMSDVCAGDCGAFGWNFGFFAGWINDFLLLMCAAVMLVMKASINGDNSALNAVENPTFNLDDNV